MDWNSWLKEHRSNAFFWLLRAGNGSVMGTVGHAFANSLHGHPTDWVLFTLFVSVGVALSVFAYRFQPKTVQTAASDTTERIADDASGTGSGSEDQARIAEQFAANEDVRRRQDMQQKADLYRARRGCEIEREERKAAQRRAEVAEAQVRIFTSLQWKAIELARDLRHFLSEMPPPKTRNRSEFADESAFFSDGIATRGAYSDKLRIMYARQYAVRVKTLVEDFTLIGVGDAHLQKYVDEVSSPWHVGYVAAALIKMAHQMDFPEICKEHDSWTRS